MSRHGIIALGVVAALALHPARTSAAPPPVAGPTTHAKLSIDGTGLLVTYVGGLGSNNAVTVGAAGKTGGNIKNPGKLDFMTLIVSRTRTDDYLVQWRRDVVAGKGTYKRDATLEFLDADGKSVSKFALTNAWPAQYAVSAVPLAQPSQKASSQEGETVTFAYENLVRVQ